MTFRRVGHGYSQLPGQACRARTAASDLENRRLIGGPAPAPRPSLGDGEIRTGDPLARAGRALPRNSRGGKGSLRSVALGASDRGLARLRLPRRWIVWLRSAVAEEVELESAIRPAPGRWPDAAIAAGSLVVVVAASVTMERAASALGNHFAIPEIVVGGLVLAAVTSLPNVVAAVYLAARGRGAATLSTALNSNRGLPLTLAFHPDVQLTAR